MSDGTILFAIIAMIFILFLFNANDTLNSSFDNIIDMKVINEEKKW